MDQELLEMVSKAERPPTKKRTYKFISQEEEEPPSDPSLQSAPTLLGQELQKKREAQAHKKRKIEPREKGFTDDVCQQKMATAAFFCSSFNSRERAKHFGGQALAPTQNSKQQWDAKQVEERGFQAMEGVDFPSSEGNNRHYFQPQRLKQRQQAIPYFKRLNQHEWHQSDSIEAENNNAVGNQNSVEAQDTDMSHKFKGEPPSLTPGEAMSDLNEEEKGRKQKLEKCIRRSCSSVKGKPQDCNAKHHQFLKPSSNHQLNCSFVEFKKPLIKHSQQNEDEELICLRGQKDLMFNQRLDEVSEIADKGEIDAPVELSYMEDGDHDIQPGWNVNLLNEFETIIEREKESLDAITSSELRQLPSNSKRSEPIQSHFHQPRFTTEELISQQENNTFGHQRYSIASMQAEDSMICDGEGFSQFTQYHGGEASDLLNEGFVAEQHSMVTEPPKRKQLEAQNSLSPMQANPAFANIFELRSAVGKKHIENFQLNQSF